jgi:hypothetical protein
VAILIKFCAGYDAEADGKVLLNENDVETVVLLSDKRVDGHIDIDLDVEKLESKGGRATYAEIKDYVKGKYGYSISSLYIA